MHAMNERSGAYIYQLRSRCACVHRRSGAGSLETPPLGSSSLFDGVIPHTVYTPPSALSHCQFLLSSYGINRRLWDYTFWLCPGEMAVWR